MKQKKGYFFMIDAIIAVFVLVMGIMIVFSFFLYEPISDQTTFISFDLINYFSENKIKDVNDAVVGPNGIMHKSGNITNLDNSLLQQIGEFYYLNVSKNINTLNITNGFISNISKELVLPYYGVLVLIENTTIFNRTGYLAVSINNSIVLIPSKRIVYGIYNQTELFGPYLVEVIVWK